MSADKGPGDACWPLSHAWTRWGDPEVEQYQIYRRGEKLGDEFVNELVNVQTRSCRRCNMIQRRRIRTEGLV